MNKSRIIFGILIVFLISLFDFFNRVWLSPVGVNEKNFQQAIPQIHFKKTEDTEKFLAKYFYQQIQSEKVELQQQQEKEKQEKLIGSTKSNKVNEVKKAWQERYRFIGLIIVGNKKQAVFDYNTTEKNNKIITVEVGQTFVGGKLLVIGQSHVTIGIDGKTFDIPLFKNKIIKI